MQSIQSEVESLTILLDQSETRSLSLSKQCATLESQLNESKLQASNEAEQKMSAVSRARQAEEEMIAAREELEEERDLRKQQEMKMIAQSQQVDMMMMIVAFIIRIITFIL